MRTALLLVVALNGVELLTSCATERPTTRRPRAEEEAELQQARQEAALADQRMAAWQEGCGNTEITSQQELDCADWSAEQHEGAVAINKHLRAAVTKAQTRPELCRAVAKTQALSISPGSVLGDQDPALLGGCAQQAQIDRQDRAERHERQLEQQVLQQQVHENCLNRCTSVHITCVAKEGQSLGCSLGFRACKDKCQ